MAFDYNISRIAAHITRRFIDGSPEQRVHVIAYPERGMVHVMYPDEMKCSLEMVEDFPFYPERCISEYAEYSGRATFADQVETDTWIQTIPDEPEYKLSGFYARTVSAETCLPFLESFMGRQKAWGMSQQIVTTMGYYNYEMGISEPESFFDLPDYCTERESEKPRKDRD